MLDFLWRLFEWPLSPAGQAGRKSRRQQSPRDREVSRRVRAIEKHLDDASVIENSTADIFDPYNLVDWNLGPGGQMTSPIYLGSAIALTDTNILKNVGGIITIIDSGRCPKSAVEQALKEQNPNANLLYLPLDDDAKANISKYFDISANFLRYHQHHGIPVFVHCMAGMSRSSTLVANYLMKKYNINALTALDMLKKRRPIVRPNSGFIRQLVETEELAEL